MTLVLAKPQQQKLTNGNYNAVGVEFALECNLEPLLRSVAKGEIIDRDTIEQDMAAKNVRSPGVVAVLHAASVRNASTANERIGVFAWKAQRNTGTNDGIGVINALKFDDGNNARQIVTAVTNSNGKYTDVALLAGNAHVANLVLVLKLRLDLFLEQRYLHYLNECAKPQSYSGTLSMRHSFKLFGRVYNLIQIDLDVLIIIQ